jgi:hypothetical protein
MSRSGPVLQVRVTEEEKARIAARAEANGMSVSEFVRNQALGEKVVRLPPVRKGSARLPKKGSPPMATRVGPPAGHSPAVDPGETVHEIPPTPPSSAETREQFLARRRGQLYGQGRTSRVAQMEAEAEWRSRG